jgi:hypothetical protein
MRRVLIASLFLATSALAGPYDQPWSIIETDVARSADSHLRPVIVNRVDGENSINNRAVVAPGPHKVTVDVPPRKGYSLATQATFDLETKPCMRYYVAAELKSPTLQQWDPVVRREERIGECEAKFKVAGGK